MLGESDEPPAERLRAPAAPRWIVVNQSVSPAFVQLIVRLAEHFGPAEIWTGTPFEPRSDVVRIRTLPSYDRSSVRTRARTWTEFAAVAAARLAMVRGKPFVLAVTNPPFVPQVAWAAHAMRGLPFGVLVWDLYPEHVVQMGLLNSGHPLIRTWQRTNAVAFRDARCLVTLGPKMVAAVRAQLRVADAGRRIDAIPNWADIHELRPVPRDQNPFAIEHGLVDARVVMYSGNLGAAHDLGPMLRAAETLRDRTDLRFVVIGDGAGAAEVARVVRERKLENVLQLPRQPWDRIRYSLGCADIAVVSQAAGTEHLSVPSKTYPALAVGSALGAITTADSDLGALVRTEGCGFVACDADAFTASLRALLDTPSRLAQMRENARQAAILRFSEEAVLEQWVRVLEPCIGEASAARRG